MSTDLARLRRAAVLSLALAVGAITSLTPAAFAQAATSIRGRVVDAEGRPVTAGAITARPPGEARVVAGANPAADGRFVLASVLPGTYDVQIRAMGYSPLVRRAVVASGAPLDLGTIRLTHIAVQMGAQVVTANRDLVQLAPDRNSYTTREMHATMGGTAIDVLRDVPGIDVDESNHVSVRGNANVIVQINGRPMPLKGDQLATFLAQLPATVITRVEVAANPSAKEDADGTAGLINLVLNRQAELALSGGVNVTAGTNARGAITGTVGAQHGRFTWLASYNLSTATRPASGETDLRTLTDASAATVHSATTTMNTMQSQTGMLRMEVRVRAHDAVTLDALAANGHSTRDGTTAFTAFDGAGTVVGQSVARSVAAARHQVSDVALGYRHPGDSTHRSVTAQLDWQPMGMPMRTDLTAWWPDPARTAGLTVPPAEHDDARGSLPTFSAQSDVTQPLGAHAKLETGVKALRRETNSGLTAAVFDSASGTFQVDPTRSVATAYREWIDAGYALLSQQRGWIQWQEGLRLETASSQLTIPGLTGDSAHVRTQYASAYPSAVLRFGADPMRSVGISYARRVQRPDPMQLSPVTVRQDAQHLMRGNPALRPEYTDALELPMQDMISLGMLQVTPFVRRTAHAVRSIETTDSTGTTLRTFANVAEARTQGADVNAMLSRGPIRLMVGGSIAAYTSDARNLRASYAADLSTHAVVWNAHVTTTWTPVQATSLQAVVHYSAPRATEGGQVGATTFTAFSLRQTLWHDQGTLTIRTMDPFDLARFTSTTRSAQRVQTNVQRAGLRGLAVTFSRTWGKPLTLRPKTPAEGGDDMPMP